VGVGVKRGRVEVGVVSAETGDEDPDGAILEITLAVGVGRIA
jgi:hypothetical protein